MSKDLEKEYLADLDHYDEGMGIHSTSYEKCKERLIRLASIDNAEPSEALECLKHIKKYYIPEPCSAKTYDCLETIKQALIKAEKEHKALEILKRNVKVGIDYGVEKKDISMALVFYIDNKKTIYVVDEAIKEQTPEHFKELELLKEVLE